MKLSPSVIVRDITSKQLTIITVALLQIIFGIVTLVCNESIFNKLLTEVRIVIIINKFQCTNIYSNWW